MRPAGDPSNLPWFAVLLGYPVIGLWYWCTDQYIVQRMLGARDETQARRGTILAACLKLLPVFIFIIPGMIAFALAKSGMVPALQSEIIDPATGEVDGYAWAENTGWIHFKDSAGSLYKVATGWRGWTDRGSTT